jgi:starch synthase
MYAMRYGAVPVAHAAGGVRDTVVDCDASLATGTGFTFAPAAPDDLYAALARGLVAYQRRESFAKLRRRVMRVDWSWDRSARRYQSLYESLVQPEEPTGP